MRGSPLLHLILIIAQNAERRKTEIVPPYKKAGTEFPILCQLSPYRLTWYKPISSKDPRRLCKNESHHMITDTSNTPPTKPLIKTKRLHLVVRGSPLLHLVSIIAWNTGERNTVIVLSYKKTGNSVPAPHILLTSKRKAVFELACKRIRRSRITVCGHAVRNLQQS